MERGMKGGTFRIILIALAMLAVAGLSLAVVLGFFGYSHPAFDSLSHFRIHFAAMLVFPGLLLAVIAQGRERRVGLLGIVFAGAVTAATLGTSLGGPVAPAAAEAGDFARYRLLHLNLRFDNEDQAAFLSLLGAEQPDVVTLVEVSTLWAERLAATEAMYPHRIICRRGIRIGGAAILSKRPFTGEPPRCIDRGAMALATVDFNGNPVQVGSLHMGWPWPREDERQMPALAPELANLGPRAIIGSDLNAAWWSTRVKVLMALGGLELAGRGGTTWLHRRLPDALRPLIGLPIDHVMAKGGVITLDLRRGADVGSDHLPMVFDFALLPETAAPSVMTAGNASGLMDALPGG
jgi:endonuclease/exonuclease/phosphatase (EEP) superfamily protein YafD